MRYWYYYHSIAKKITQALQVYSPGNKQEKGMSLGNLKKKGNKNKPGPEMSTLSQARKQQCWDSKPASLALRPVYLTSHHMSYSIRRLKHRQAT